MGWSGGADSTMLLTERAWGGSREHPIIALTIDAHPSINALQMRSQLAAQKRYLAWAKRKSLHIEVRRLTVSGAYAEDFLRAAGGQALIWISHIVPYLPKACSVEFGFIKHDDFWHRRAEADAALEGLRRLAGASWTVGYPYEWSSKAHILASLKSWGVPDNCWWTCEDTKRVGVACGACAKCRALKDGQKAAAAMATKTKGKKP